MEQLAVMNLDKGEEVASMLVGGHIKGTGRYKFLAKKKKNGKYEWAHFTERDNGNKENVYRGEVKSKKELDLVIEIMNKNLKRIFGNQAEMAPGFPEVRTLDGKKVDGTIN